MICLMCILFNRNIQIKTVLRLNLSIKLIVCQNRTDAVREADIVLIEMKIILLDLFLNWNDNLDLELKFRITSNLRIK